MKMTSVFLSILAAALLLSATAFSGSGPYGSFGPSDNLVLGQTVDSQQHAAWGGSGPYGAFGPIDKGIGTPSALVASGSGPYGAFDGYGMRGAFSYYHTANKENCLLVATICPVDLKQ
jgi:hypothetical protein